MRTRLKSRVAGIAAAALMTGGAVAAVAPPAEAICNPNPPDYAGCTMEQVKAIAHDNDRDWFNHHRFGQSANVLSKLTANQKDRVEAAMRAEVRDNLQKDRAQSMTATATADELSKWTTNWRGNSYTVDGFPYGRYVDVWERGTTDYGGCTANMRDFQNLFAYSWCEDGNTPDWSYWQLFADTVDNPGTQTELVCAKEIVVGASTGATAGAIASIWTGPGAAAAAGIGGISGGGAGLVGCAVDHLWDKVF